MMRYWAWVCGARRRKAIAPGAKAHFFARLERAKAEALAYLKGTRVGRLGAPEGARG